MRELKCSTCGVHFAITEEFWQYRHEDGRSIICPNGHPVFFRITKEAAFHDALVCVRKQVKDYKKLYEEEQHYADLFERSNIALRGVITRMKNKARNRK